MIAPHISCRLAVVGVLTAGACVGDAIVRVSVIAGAREAARRVRAHLGAPGSGCPTFVDICNMGRRMFYLCLLVLYNVRLYMHGCFTRLLIL